MNQALAIRETGNTLLQRKKANIAAAPRMVQSNHTNLRVAGRGLLQPELAIGPANDTYEKEGDRATRMPDIQTNPARKTWAGTAIDMLSDGSAATDNEHTIDQMPHAAPPAAPPPAVAPPAGVGRAEPTNLLQLLTNWAEPSKYGFQLKFRCRSTSGEVHDLQRQSPNLIWRETVSYSRNDFAHRIAPNNPTVLPPGGVGFAAATTRRMGTNLLEFNGATDTHFLPSSAVVAPDFAPLGPRALPAVMESHQRYQFSTNAGASWRYFAGLFTVRRTLFREGGNLKFRTEKVGIHSKTENLIP